MRGQYPVVFLTSRLWRAKPSLRLMTDPGLPRRDLALRSEDFSLFFYELFLMAE